MSKPLFLIFHIPSNDYLYTINPIARHYSAMFSLAFSKSWVHANERYILGPALVQCMNGKPDNIILYTFKSILAANICIESLVNDSSQPHRRKYLDRIGIKMPEFLCAGEFVIVPYDYKKINT